MAELDELAQRAWEALPEAFLGSRLGRDGRQQLRSIRSRILDAVGRPAPPPQKVVTTLADVDEMLAECEQAAAVSDDALRAVFLRHRMELDQGLPADPFSSEYRDAVLDCYEWLAGKPYSASNECIEFDVTSHLRSPFPYATASSATVGEHLIGVGNLIRAAALRPGSRVLELGSGWGNVTLALAQMGHEVTAVEIAPRFVELLRARAEAVGVPLDVVHGDFAVVGELDTVYDCVVFFESFHHCADHLGLLAALQRVVAPGGHVVFAAESVSKSMPVPWGLRLDGESLWAIRQNGWLELGFRTSYFRQALARTGWHATRTINHSTPWGEVYVAARAPGWNGVGVASE